jgi:hypothetical protein
MFYFIPLGKVVFIVLEIKLPSKIKLTFVSYVQFCIGLS